MEHQATAEEIKRAEKLHAVLLFDFIVIHVFYFVLALGMIKSGYALLMAMPVISVSLLVFVIFKAQQSKSTEPSWFVRCHMLLAAKRAKLFLLLFVVTGTFSALMILGGQGLGLSPIASKSLAFGVGQLPFMVALLALVVLEYDAAHQSKVGKIPAAAIALHPKEA